MKEIAETRVRYGYRRVHVLLRREGWTVNHKRTYKLYKELGLQLRSKLRSAGSRRSSARIANLRFARTMSGRWTSSTISLPPGRRSAS